LLSHTLDRISLSYAQLVWSDPDEEGIKAFLVGEKQFSESRIMSALKRIKKGEEKRSQGRIDSFFGAAVKRPVRR